MLAHLDGFHAQTLGLGFFWESPVRDPKRMPLLLSLQFGFLPAFVLICLSGLVEM